ncbi:MAG: hypothetical protein LBQ86_02625 [Holophagales bacterium]|nr:hypothetical protein [Holophagales bacterium]
MSACRFILSMIFNLYMLTAGASALAQSYPGQWVGDLYLIYYRSNDSIARIFIDENSIIHKTIPSVSQAVDFPAPPWRLTNSWRSSWRNDALYTFAYGADETDEDGSRFLCWTLAKWKDDEWHFLGDFKANTRMLLEAIPCDNDRFILISSTDYNLIDDNRPDRTPFHVISVPPGKTELSVDYSIDHGQDELRRYMSNPDFFNLAWLSSVIMTDSHAILVNDKTGLYWVFSLEKASLIHAGSIFKKVTPEMIARGGFGRAVLCVNPEKDGNVLIAAQEEDFFIKETSDPFTDMNEFSNTFQTDDYDVLNQLLTSRLKEYADRSPFIIWHRIYPESGKVELLASPPEGSTFFRSDLGIDVWRPMRDGSIKMGWSEDDIKYKTVRPKEEAGEKDDLTEENKNEQERATEQEEALSDKKEEAGAHVN